MQRIIMHIDFDYFYAQVEEVERKVKDRPVVVCMFSGRTAESGAVATANYLARKYGVGAGIPIFQAKAKLKGTDALFLPANHQLYAEKSFAIMQLLEKFTDKLEPASIDEAFLDVSEKCDGDYKKAEKLVKEIKKAIYEKFKLTCSIGIAPNKLVAKIASDFQKPDGLTIVKPEEVQNFLDPLDADDIPGIGKKTTEFLAEKNIKTVADLRKADRGFLVETFGKKTGAWLMMAARGEDESPVGIFQEQKQISRIKTLKKNTRSIEEIMEALEELVEDIVAEIREEDLLFGSVGINAIDEDLKMHTKSRKLPHPSEKAEDIRWYCRELYAGLLQEMPVEFRRVGVRIEKLQSKKGQKTLGEF